jgi:hypothetical protein
VPESIPLLERMRELEPRSMGGQPPVIWDNLHANDYDMRRLYLGPYSGRPPELRGEVGGILHYTHRDAVFLE